MGGWGDGGVGRGGGDEGIYLEPLFIFCDMENTSVPGLHPFFPY